jgi:hypothetical protein
MKADGWMSTEDLHDHDGYVERFDRVVGAIRPGQYGRYRNRLVLKMNSDQYRRKVEEYEDLGRRLGAMMNAGDTIDDTLVTALRAAEIDLVLERSRFLPEFGPRD